MTRRPATQPDPFGNGVILSVRKDGRMRVRWFDPPDCRDDRTRREKNFRDPHEARAFAWRLSRELGTHNTATRSDQERRALPWWTVRDRWLAVQQTEWEPDIARQNHSVLVRWAEPHLGELPFAEIRREDYQRVFAAMTDAGRLGSRNRVRALLAQLERWAADNGYGPWRSFPIKSFPRTAAHGVRTAGTDELYVPETLRPDPARIARLREAVTELGRPPRWWRGLQLDVAANCGLRLGEQFALRSCSVGLEGGTLAVNWQYVTRPGNPHSLKRPKNEKTRTAVFFPSMADDLARRIAEIDGRDDPPCPDCTDPNCGLLFPAPRGGPHTRGSFGTHVARAGFEATKVDSDPKLRWPKNASGGWLWTWHSLRHAAAVALIDRVGLPVSDVSLLLGHSEDVLLRRYYGAVEGTVRRARDALQGL